MINSKKTWGGHREGSGRKRLENPNKRYGFVSSPETSTILESVSNKSDFINEAIIFYHSHLHK